MTDNDLLTPKVKRWSVWTILAGLTLYLAVIIWHVNQERFLSPANVELGQINTINTAYCFYHVAFAMIRLCSAGVLAFTKKYGLTKSLLYLGFVTVLSYVLVVYLMDIAALETVHFLKNSLEVRLERSVVEIEERRGPIKQRYPTGVVPYSIEEHTKYEGEDSVFECYRMFSYPTDVYPARDQVVWEKNGMKIHPSDHINISWTFERVIADNNGSKDKLNHYLISSKLILYFIDQADYGNYSCMIKKWALRKEPLHIPPPKPKPPMCPLEPPPSEMCFCLCFAPPPIEPTLELPMPRSRWQDQYETIKVFSLVRMQEVTRKVHVPPGGMVSFSATYDHLGDIDDVSFDYTIGGKPFDSICGGILKQCSLIVKIYWFYFHRGGHKWDLFSSFGSVRMRTAVTGTGWQCVCKEAYNYHEFWFYRTFFNVTSGKKEIRGVRYPHRILLASRTPDLFFYNFTNKIDPLAKEPCWVRPQKYQAESCQQDEESVKLTLKFLLKLETCVIVITGIFCLSFIGILSFLLTAVAVPIRNKILVGSFYPCKGCVGTSTPLGYIHEEEDVAIRHDVFISHAENELSEGHQMTGLLENLGLSVYHPHRDILGGQIKTDAISAAIASSRRFIVILTKAYIDSGMHNRFEFQLILNRALEKTADYKKLLIVKRDQVQVPNVLNNFSMLDWTTNDNVDVNCRCLRNWSKGKVNSGYICVCK